MKLGQKQSLKASMAAFIGCSLVAGFAVDSNASTVTVTDITDWGTTPVEIVNANIPYLGYNGGVYAGINTLQVTDGNNVSTVYSGFCIDPFHWSLSGPISGYQEVTLDQGPKAPGTLNSDTVTDIEKLWALYYSSTMTSYNAAGLQIAIWELVSDSAVANGLPSNMAFSLDGSNDYGAAADIASLADYNGPLANLMVLTGRGQDYVIDPPRAPDSGATILMLALTVGGLFVARPGLLKSLEQRRAAVIPTGGN